MVGILSGCICVSVDLRQVDGFVVYLFWNRCRDAVDLSPFSDGQPSYFLLLV